MRAGIALLAVGLLGGCVSKQTYEDTKKELDLRVSDLEKEKSRLEKENDALHAEVRKLKESLERQAIREVMVRLGIDEGDTLKTRLDTSKGSITCELWPAKAPQTVLNFVELAEGTRSWTDPATGRKMERPLYNGTVIHRVIPGFMIQAGDPLGNGTGGPGYRFADEIVPGLTFSEPGLLAMANAGPNTNGSQFFITDRATPHHLDGKHTIFGKCENLDVVEAIASVERDSRDRPVKDVTLDRVTILRP